LNEDPDDRERPDRLGKRDEEALRRAADELGERIREVRGAHDPEISAWERRRAAGRRGYQPGLPSGEAWNIVGTLAAGMAFWAAVGYGVDRLAGTGTVFLPIGAVVGLAGALYLAIYRLRRR
jgi:F0F1-type ATP synthase assembly protein I